MSNNNKNNKSEQKNAQAELNAARTEWKEKYETCCEKIANLGYNIDGFAEVNLDSCASLASHSKAIGLQQQYQALLEHKKTLWPEEAVVEELNKKHAIVHTGQTYVLTEKDHPVLGGKDFSLESRASFKMYYEDEVIVCANQKKQTKADIWLTNSERRKYSNIIFDPTLAPQLAEEKKLYNLWKGFTKKPKQGDCSKYWEHVKNNICAGDKKAYAFVRGWMAYVFQHPDEVHTALVICGSQGVGKNSFVEPLGVLLGNHYVLLSNITELITNFNFHLKNAVLIHANEAFWGGNKKDLGTLKAMITEKTCLIEGKGKDRIMVKNYKHVIISSNEDWPVHLEPSNRRFFVLQVSDAHKEDIQYFKAIQEQLDNDGYEALLYDLLHEDINSFDPHRLPDNPHAFDIQMYGANSTQKYIYEEILLDDQLNLDNKENCHTKNEIYQAYELWCEKNNEQTMPNNLFCKELKKLIPSIKTIRPGAAASRQRMYEFPNLKKAREEFCNFFKATDAIWSTE